MLPHDGGRLRRLLHPATWNPFRSGHRLPWGDARNYDTWEAEQRRQAQQRYAKAQADAGEVLRAVIPEVLAGDLDLSERSLVSELGASLLPDQPATYDLLQPHVQGLAAVLAHWPSGDLGHEPALLEDMREGLTTFVEMNFLGAR